jgi:hypothetical protein
VPVTVVKKGSSSSESCHLLLLWKLPSLAPGCAVLHGVREKKKECIVKDRIRTCASEDTAYTAFDSRAAR